MTITTEYTTTGQLIKVTLRQSFNATRDEILAARATVDAILNEWVGDLPGRLGLDHSTQEFVGTWTLKA